MIQDKRHMDTEEIGLEALRPLATYDNRAVEELEELNRMSEELTRESEALKAELQRLNRQLQAGDGKLRIKSLQAEQAQFEDLADRVGVELLRLRSEIGSIKIDLEPHRIDLEYERLTQEIASLIKNRDELNRAIPLLEAEVTTLERDIQQRQARIEEQSKATQDLLGQIRGVSQRVSALKGLRDAFLGQRDATHDAYKDRLIRLAEGLKRGDPNTLSEVQSLCNELAATIGANVADAFGLIGARFGLLKEMHEKGQGLPSLRAESETLQRTIKEKAEALERLKALNANDKSRAEELQHQLAGLKEEVSRASEEVSKLRQLTSNRDEAEAEFRSLYVQNVELVETVQAVSNAMQGLRQLLR
jgi:chromosome segregation ATPase